MTREEVIDGLKVVRTIHNGNYAQQIDYAIKSLDMWDKIIEEIKYNYDDFITISNVEIISKDDVIKIIEKYKKEIE